MQTPANDAPPIIKVRNVTKTFDGVDAVSELNLTVPAGICFGLGIIGFSGGLYGLALTGNSGFGIAAPTGGTLMIVGWFLFAAGTCPCGTRSPTPS